MAIKPIDTWSIDQITSGQVVTNISSAVKELLENSIDAGATVIEIKLESHGRDGFKVQDNGSGVDEADFDFLAHKHATSKLEQFSDLGRVSTLGFRGEALASLCALAKVNIITSTGGGYGFELDMNSDGSVRKKSKVATPKGTLVSVNDLFYGLPVRRKDFERNYLREYTKVISIVQEYALLSSARITVEHINKNRSNLTLKSQGTEMMQRIASVYGFKRTKVLERVSFTEMHLPGRGVAASGYISKPAIGMGDSAATCQLIAINNRPSQQPRLSRMIVDVYKQYNITETPFFVINLTMDTTMYDVNISPDKRSLLLHNEDKLIESLRTAFVKLFDELDHTIPRSHTEVPAAKRSKNQFLSFSAFRGSGEAINQQPCRGEDLTYQEFNTNDRSSPIDDSASEESEAAETSIENEPIPGIEDSRGDGDNTDDLSEDNSAESVNKNQDDAVSEGFRYNGSAGIVVKPELFGDDEEESTIFVGSPCCGSPDRNIMHNPTITAIKENENNLPGFSLKDLKKELGLDLDSHNGIPSEINETLVDGRAPANMARPNSQRIKTLNTHIHLPLTLDGISEALKIEQKEQSRNTDGTPLKLKNLSIDEEGVEERLQLCISKNDFENMEVVGQFNLGFILVVNHKAKHDDLFVIDQHASDEIYNFERLQRNTVLSRQPLISPHRLELSAVEELTIQQHMGIFENNGFTISIRENEPPGHQCFLESVPYSKSTIFDDRDVFELLSKVKEEPNNKDLRCSKLRDMFAMRACRSSIMVGRPLDIATMRKVVRHLGALDKPWNCPHGRPTLRHITSLS